MAETKFSRKLESTGRIMIPVKLREKMGMEPGREYDFSTLEKDGQRYILIHCGEDKSLSDAMKLIQQAGYKIEK